MPAGDTEGVEPSLEERGGHREPFWLLRFHHIRVLLTKAVMLSKETTRKYKGAFIRVHAI